MVPTMDMAVALQSCYGKQPTASWPSSTLRQSKSDLGLPIGLSYLARGIGHIL